ncbi:hypothetical protein C0991_007922 [Blastosporella zonata]|nr:hypothetical protein C0991_007922 [Blastosporella zonata]
MGNPMMELGAIDDLGRRLGMFMSVYAFGALAGPPISGAINTATGGFEAVGYYAGGVASLTSISYFEYDVFHTGTMVMIAVGLMCLTRHLVLRRALGRF